MQNSLISLFGEKVKMKIPEEFTLMTTEQAKLFFLGTVPEILYGIEEKRAFISITHTDITIETENLERRITEYYQLYNRSIANFANGGLAKRLLQDGTPIGVFHYTSTTADRDLINYFALFPLKGKEVVMSMHCSIEDSLVIAKKFLEVLNSITIC